MRRPIRRRVQVVLGLLLALSVGQVQTTADRPALQVGVLIADPQHRGADYSAGVRLAVLELRWQLWQPRAGYSDEAYRAERRHVADGYRAAGFRVAVDVGLQHPPQWVLDMPDGQLQAQDGGRSGSANYVFNRDVRAAGAAYMSAVVARMGPVWSYRVGLSPEGEALYPQAPDNQWWAFDAAAQGRASGLPDGLTPSPLPGWVPGDGNWRGEPVSRAQVQQWFDWYLGASVAAHRWQVEAYRAAGFTGWLQLVLPGLGVLPADVQARLHEHLAPRPGDRFHTMNRAAVWDRLLAALRGHERLAVDVSSVYDESGQPRASACRPDDDRVPVDDVTPAWSSTRWLTSLSRRYGYAMVVGESTGDNSAADMAGALRLAQQCRLAVLQWAWDFQLHDGEHASLDDLVRLHRDVA